MSEDDSPFDGEDVETLEPVVPEPGRFVRLPNIPLAPTQTVGDRDVRPGEEGYNLDEAIQDLIRQQKQLNKTAAEISANLGALHRMRPSRIGNSQREEYLADRANERRIRAERETKKAQLQETLRELNLV